MKRIAHNQDCYVGGRFVKAGEPIDVAEIGLPTAKQMVKDGLAVVYTAPSESGTDGADDAKEK